MNKSPSKRQSTERLVSIAGGAKIHVVGGVPVMTDSDLAELYGVEVRALNQAVKRNEERFPPEFRFQLTAEDADILKSQSVISSANHGGRRSLPYVFTEQGVAMLSAVLRSGNAVRVSIQIMRAFVEMRRFSQAHTQLFARMDSVERRQIMFESDTGKKFEKLFDALEGQEIHPKQGVFFDGQIYDAYLFAANLIRKAKKSLVLLDNYIDDSTLTLFSKRSDKVTVDLYTKSISKELALDVKKHNDQYPEIRLHEFPKAHDRFLVVDGIEVYHLGASLKDLGKKWFAFSRLETGAAGILERLGVGG